MGELREAMITHMKYLVLQKHMPFSYLDFMRFEVNEKEYTMTHGTFRNNISRLIKEGLLEIAYRSNITFYTLRGVKLGKASRIAVTGNHTGVPHSSASVSSTSSLSSHPLYKVIRNLPLDKRSVHDLHLRFASPRIYGLSSLSISKGTLGYDHSVNVRSKDILLQAWEINGLLIKLSIHRTDIVSVVVGCSLDPITLDVNGIIRLTNVLSVVKDRLSRIVEGSKAVDDSMICENYRFPNDRRRHVCVIPPYFQWIVTMWHFGADASIEYAGKKFSFTWETVENVLIRAYTKEMKDNKTRVRLERQEYPRTTLADAIEQKINGIQQSGGLD